MLVSHQFHDFFDQRVPVIAQHKGDDTFWYSGYKKLPIVFRLSCDHIYYLDS